MAASEEGAADGPERPADQRLDARGLVCPLPVLRAQKRLTAMAPGEILEVLATDPAAPEDFRGFCAATGHRLLVLEADDEGSRLRIARARQP